MKNIKTKSIFSRSKKQLIKEARERLLARKDIRGQSIQHVPMKPREQFSPCPVSFAQERMWFFEQIAPGKPVYNIPGAYRIRGELNLTVVSRAFKEIVRRHEALRTMFAEQNGKPVQIISAKSNVEIDKKDLTGQEAEEQETEIRERIQSAVDHVFDLKRGPLFKFELLKLSNDEHVLILNFHHIIIDGWSLGLFLKEFSVLYNAYMNSGEGGMPEPIRQYPDYTIWQRQQMHGELINKQLRYWKKTLGDLPPMLALPADRKLPVQQNFQGQVQSFVLANPLVSKLMALCQGKKLTPFMLMTAAYQVLLFRYTQQTDIIVGTPVANRNRPETHGMLGLLLNTLPLRSKFTADMSFEDLLKQVKENCLLALDNQDLPLEKIVVEVQPKRETNRPTLFQTMLVFQSGLQTSLALKGTVVEPIKIEQCYTDFDITLVMNTEGDEWRGAIKYRAGMFEKASMERMAGHLKTILECIVDNPQEKIAEIQMLPATERRKILKKWNKTGRKYQTNTSLHRLFEKQVFRNPDAPAVVFENEILTFQVLNERANCLANYLVKQDWYQHDNSEKKVGIYLERSPEMVIGILGVLKAGCSYVPLDVNQPVSRLNYIIKDTALKAIVTKTTHTNKLAANIQTIDLDKDWEEISGESKENLALNIAASQLAYVLYTSGSTGNPKGVLIEHRQVLNYIFGIIERYELTEGASYAMLQPLAVDSSVSTLYPPLLNGGVLHLIRKDLALDADALSEYFHQHRIDCLKIAPSHFAALRAATKAPNRIMPQKWLIIGGEASQTEWLEALKNSAPTVAVFNHYGPTEATVGMLTCPVTLSASNNDSPNAPVGKPLPNTKAFVLDKNLQPVPIGVRGELYIGGDCLARGYLNQPELTREKFIHWETESGKKIRLYRSGDMVKFLPDGNIEFLQRIDHQVKINGFRVELGEIEAVILQHPKVAAVAVVLQEDMPEKHTLVAHVVSTINKEDLAGNLKRFLKDKLPAYMIPSLFSALQDLPRTSHGKRDYNALPKVSLTQAESVQVAETETQKQFLVIWQKIIGVDGIGTHDNFFDVGGHSLLAMQLVAKTRKEFSIELPLKALFENPTIADLADYVDKFKETGRNENDLAVAQGKSLVKIQTGHEDVLPLFLIPGGVGSEDEFLMYARMIHLLGTEQPVYGFVARGTDGETPPHSDVVKMATDFILEIKAVRPNGPYILGGECIGGKLAYEMAAQLKSKGEEIVAVVLLNTALIEPNSPDIQQHRERAIKHPYVQKIKYQWNEIQRRPLEEKFGYLAEQIRNLGKLVLPDNVDARRERHRRNAGEAFQYMLRRFQPSKRLDGSITLIVSEDDYQENYFKKWTALVTGKVNLCKVPGIRPTYLGEHVESTATELRAYLLQIQQTAKGNS